jgi:hypothetical protein
LESKEADFDPSQFVDHYEEAVVDMLKKKQAGIPATREHAAPRPQNVVNLVDALRRSIEQEKRAPVRSKKERKRIEGQAEMLLPIPGKRARKKRQGQRLNQAHGRRRPAEFCAAGSPRLPARRASDGLRSRSDRFDRLDDRGIIVFQLVDPSRYRPHPHWGRRKRTHQVARIGLVAQPAGVVAGCEDERHAVMDFGHQFVGICRDHRESANPFAGGRFFPVLPKSANAERPAIFHGDGIGLLGFLPLDRLPLEEAVDRDDTAPPAIGISEGRETMYGLAFGVDRLAPAFRGPAPIGNKTQRKGSRDTSPV